MNNEKIKMDNKMNNEKIKMEITQGYEYRPPSTYDKIWNFTAASVFTITFFNNILHILY